MNPLPSVSQASNIVLQEEQQREIKPVPVHFNSDSAAFMSQQRAHSYHGRNIASHSTNNLTQPHPTTGTQSYSYPSMPKRALQPQPNGVQCKYCKKLRHTIDKCYKLQRQRSERGQLNRSRRVAASVQQVDTSMEVTAGHSSGQHTLTSE